MKALPLILSMLLAAGAGPPSATAQSLPSATEFQSLLTTCAQGQELNIDANLIGSVTSVYEGERTSGNMSLSSQTKFLELFPPEDRLEALRLYNDCIVKFIDGYRPAAIERGYPPGPSYTPGPPPPGPNRVPQPSFACSRASTPTERLMCWDADLADADSAMASRYFSLMDRANQTGFAASLRSAQRSWIAWRDNVCPVRESTLHTGTERAAAVDCLIRVTGERAEQLASGNY